LTSGENSVQISVRTSDGRVNNWRGSWIQKYTIFEYVANGIVYTARLINTSRIDITGTNGTATTWTLASPVRPASQPPAANSYPYADFIKGRWTSTSGNITDVTSQGRNVYLTFYMTDGRTLKGSGYWLDSTTFSYRVDGYADSTTVTVMSDGRLKTIRSGADTITYWSR
jgi:hypothetical protein